MAVAEQTRRALRSRVEVVTPEMATAWLERNESNRNVIQTTVERYARDMREGNWIVTGEAIQFGQSGRLLNGQHRLWACIEAGVAFETLVVRGLENETAVMERIDTGTKRTLAHVLQISGEVESNKLAAIINGCWMYQRSRYRDVTYPSHAEGLEWFSENLGVRQAVQVGRMVYASIKAPQGSMVGVAYYLNALIDPAASEEFWTLAATGEGLPNGSPILAYRRWVIATLAKRDNKPTPPVCLAYNLKAMNLWRAGKKLRMLGWRDNEGMPETWRG